ncbi:MAG: hypothetical protein ABIE14_03825 [Patescibacteria group bacterium]
MTITALILQNTAVIVTASVVAVGTAVAVAINRRYLIGRYVGWKHRHRHKTKINDMLENKRVQQPEDRVRRARDFLFKISFETRIQEFEQFKGRQEKEIDRLREKLTKLECANTSEKEEENTRINNLLVNKKEHCNCQEAQIKNEIAETKKRLEQAEEKLQILKDNQHSKQLNQSQDKDNKNCPPVCVFGRVINGFNQFIGKEVSCLSGNLLNLLKFIFVLVLIVGMVLADFYIVHNLFEQLLKTKGEPFAWKSETSAISLLVTVGLVILTHATTAFIEKHQCNILVRRLKYLGIAIIVLMAVGSIGLMLLSAIPQKGQYPDAILRLLMVPVVVVVEWLYQRYIVDEYDEYHFLFAPFRIFFSLLLYPFCLFFYATEASFRQVKQSLESIFRVVSGTRKKDLAKEKQHEIVNKIGSCNQQISELKHKDNEAQQECKNGVAGYENQLKELSDQFANKLKEDSRECETKIENHKSSISHAAARLSDYERGCKSVI